MSDNGEQKQYTWEEKIDGLVKLAKAAGRLLSAEEEVDADYYKDAHRNLFEVYGAFCDWRHEEPYVVDEIKALLRHER